MTIKSRAGKFVQGDVGILYPHLLLSVMYHNYNAVFVEKLLGGSVQKIRAVATSSFEMSRWLGIAVQSFF